MKLAILGESETDEAVFGVLIEGLLGRPLQPIPLRNRSRGWPGVRRILPAVLLHLEYQTDAEALVVVIDSDLTPIHDGIHRGEPHPKCRVCEIIGSIVSARGTLSRPHRVKVAVGQAVPMIEAWLLAPGDHTVGEAQWRTTLTQGTGSALSVLDSLKPRCYTRPSAAGRGGEALDRARNCTTRFEILRTRFPDGFAPWADEIASW